MAGQKVAIKHQGSTELLSVCFRVRGSLHLAVSEGTQHNTSPVTEGERGGQLAKGNTIKVFPTFSSCVIQKLSSAQQMMWVYIQPPTSHQCFTVNEAGNLDRSAYNLEIQGCIIGQVNKQDSLRLSVQCHSQCVQILTAYLSSLVLTSRAAGEPMPRNGNCHSTRVTLAAHPTWQELARAGATSPPGSCSGYIEGQTTLELFKGGYGFSAVWEGRDGPCCRAAPCTHPSDVL